MTTRTALLIGIDQFEDAPPLNGARQDVIDLAKALLARGIPAGNITVATHPPLSADALPGVRTTAGGSNDIQRALVALAADCDPDGTTLVHVSSRGKTQAGQAAILTADGALAVTELAAPFAAHPVRSVVFTLDAGFGGGETHTRTAGEAAELTPMTPGDPMLLANGWTGPVHELVLDGSARGVLSWTLGQALAGVQDGSEWTFAQLQDTLRRVQATLSVDQVPVVVPSSDLGLDLGALADGGPAHVPWRGVSAMFQVTPTHIVGGGYGFSADGPGTLEYFDLPSIPAMPAGAFNTTATPGFPGPHGPPVGLHVRQFENNAFSGAAGAGPHVAAGDRLYQVVASWGWPGTVWMRAVGGKTDTTAVEWFIDVGGVDFLPINPGTITWTEAAPPTDPSTIWFSVLNSRM